jgi:hypothetical protein
VLNTVSFLLFFDEKFGHISPFSPISKSEKRKSGHSRPVGNRLATQESEMSPIKKSLNYFSTLANELVFA